MAITNNTKKIIIFLTTLLFLTLIAIPLGIFLKLHHGSDCKQFLSLNISSAPHFQNQTHWQVDLVRVDDFLSPSPKPQNFSQLFQAQMQRDLQRVVGLSSMLLPHDQYGSDVVSSQPKLGIGQYLVKVEVGNPPQTQHLVMDTGSDITWVQCADCNPCYHQVDPMFNTSASTSFCHKTCASKACKVFGECEFFRNRCFYKIKYYDGTITKGVVMGERIRIGSALVADVAMGCRRHNKGLFVGNAGVMGLGNGKMSIVNQFDIGVRDAFSYCLSSSTDLPPGWLEFGPLSFPPNAVWVPLQPNPKNPSFYYIELTGIAVGGVRLPIPEDAFWIKESGDGGVVLDSGTIITRFPKHIYEVLRNEFKAQTPLNVPTLPGVANLDTCYYIPPGVSYEMPHVSFYFPGATYMVGGRGTLIKVKEIGTHCFAFAPLDADFSIIGNVQQAGVQVSYDLRRGLVGFGPTAC